MKEIWGPGQTPGSAGATAEPGGRPAWDVDLLLIVAGIAAIAIGAPVTAAWLPPPRPRRDGGQRHATRRGVASRPGSRPTNSMGAIDRVPDAGARRRWGGLIGAGVALIVLGLVLAGRHPPWPCADAPRRGALFEGRVIPGCVIPGCVISRRRLRYGAVILRRRRRPGHPRSPGPRRRAETGRLVARQASICGSGLFDARARQLDGADRQRLARRGRRRCGHRPGS